MAELYVVEVLAKDASKVTLDVRVAHPDAPPPSDDLGTALMMLREAATPLSILGNEIKIASSGDSAWLMKNTRGYVAAAKVLSRKKPAGKKRASAHVLIEVTDPAWVEHLAVGQTWESTAFDPRVMVATKEYAARKAADPKKARGLAKKAIEAARIVELPSTPLTKESVVMVPAAAWEPTELVGETWKFKAGDDLMIEVPAEIPMPAYPPDAYVGTQRIEKPTAEQARALHGKLVRRFKVGSTDIFTDGYVIASPDSYCPAWLMTTEYKVFMLATIPVTLLALKQGKAPKPRTLAQVLTPAAKATLKSKGG